MADFREQFRKVFDEKRDELSTALKSRTKEEFEELGRFIHYHLIAEDALLKFIKLEVPMMNDLESYARQFGQKLSMAESLSNSAHIHSFYPGLRALNKIRNTFGHHPLRITYPDDQIRILKDSLKGFPIEPDTMKPIEIVKAFCVLFHTMVCALEGLKHAMAETEKELARKKEEHFQYLQNILDSIFKDTKDEQ